MILPPNCFNRKCKWYDGISQPDGTEQTEVPVCPAFPKGIPENIAYGTHLHLKMLPDQEGFYVFEEKR